MAPVHSTVNGPASNNAQVSGNALASIHRNAMITVTYIEVETLWIAGSKVVIARAW